MRRTLTVCRSGLSVAAAVVLLTACGGSDDGGSTAASETTASETSSSASETSAANEEFCAQASTIQQRVGSTLTDQTDPAAIPTALQEAATEIRAIEPPEEIAADWNALADGVEQIAAAFSGIDFNDPNALATFQQEIAALETQLGDASTNVQTYLAEECGLGTGPTESAAPSS
jgi:hypothetical protein